MEEEGPPEVGEAEAGGHCWILGWAEGKEWRGVVMGSDGLGWIFGAWLLGVPVQGGLVGEPYVSRIRFRAHGASLGGLCPVPNMGVGRLDEARVFFAFFSLSLFSSHKIDKQRSTLVHR